MSGPPPNADGNIVNSSVFFISNPRFDFKSSSNNTNYYSLKLGIYDSEYKRCQHGIGGNPPNYSSNLVWSNAKFQYQYQLPNYIIKVFKKNNTGSTNRIESCWQPLSDFNNTPHLKINSGGTTQNIPSFGVGVTPYYFYYSGNSVGSDSNGFPMHNFSYSKIGEYNAFDSNRVAQYEFDVKGGFSDYNSNISQAVRDRATGHIGNYNYGYRTKNAQGLSNVNTNDLFHEPGIYLVTIMRNSINNNNLGIGNPYWNGYVYINNDVCAINSVYSMVSQAYVRIDPPAPPITYTPNTNIVSFTFNGYGSVNYNPYGGSQAWVMSNHYLGKPNFIAGITNGAEIYTYAPSSNKDGSYPTNDVTYNITPSNSTNASIQVSTNLDNVRINLNSFTLSLYLKSAFEYDFKLSTDGNTNLGFDIFADSANGQYTNFTTVYPSDNAYWWNQCFTYQYATWRSSATKVFKSRSDTVNKSLEFFSVFGSPSNFPGITSSISFNSEFVNINNEYILKSYWVEDISSNLTNSLVGSEYTLRLYEKSKTSNSNSVEETYKVGALDNYKIISNSDTGLEISANWAINNTTTPPQYEMEVYTDKNGTIFYNSQPTSNASFVGWNEDEVKGSFLTVLQRNISHPSLTTPSLFLNGAYITNIPPANPYLIYNIDSSTGSISQFDMSNSSYIVYADAVNNWNINRFSDSNNYPLSSLTNNKSPTITEVNHSYLFDVSSNVRFVMQPTSPAISSNPSINNISYFLPPANEIPKVPLIFPIVFYPPFYNTFTNLPIQSITGKKLSDQSQSVIDLNQHFIIENSIDTWFAYASTIDEPGALNHTFANNFDVSFNYFRDNENYVKATFNMSDTYKKINNGELFINGYRILNSHLWGNLYITGPFYDLSYNQLTDISGIDSTNNPVNIKLNDWNFEISKTSNSNVDIDIRQLNTGSTFAKNTTVELLTDLKLEFTLPANSNGNTISGLPTVDNFLNFLPSNQKTHIFPPFYHPTTGNLLTSSPGNAVGVNIDLTKPLKLHLNGNTFFIYGTPTGVTGNTFSAGFSASTQTSTTYTFLRSRRRFEFLNNQTNFNGNYSGILTNQISNKFNVGSTFTETLGSYGNYTINDFSNAPAVLTNYPSSNNLLVFPDNSSNYFDSSLVKIGNEYLFHSTWTEPHHEYLTKNLVDSSYVLRLYNKDINSTSDSIIDTYINSTTSTSDAGPIDNYKYVDSTNTGLNVLPTWKTENPHTMDIYTDKNGLIFYKKPSTSDDSFVCLYDHDSSCAKIMTIQRNYTPTTSDRLYISTNASYSINVIDDASLVRVNNPTNNNMTQLQSKTYQDSSCVWSVLEKDTNNTIILDGIADKLSPSRTEVDAAYPNRVGTGLITNKIKYNFDVGNIFTEKLPAPYDISINTSFINNVEQTQIDDFSTNSVIIYEPIQLDDSQYHFSDMKYTFLPYDTSKVYFDINFNEPSNNALRPEAYDINIFKKEKGTGTALSQWYPSGEYGIYKWTDENNRGVTIPKTNIPNSVNKYRIDTSGQVFAKDKFIFSNDYYPALNNLSFTMQPSSNNASTIGGRLNVNNIEYGPLDFVDLNIERSSWSTLNSYNNNGYSLGWYKSKTGFTFSDKFTIFWDATYDGQHDNTYNGLCYAGKDGNGYILQQNRNANNASFQANRISALIPNRPTNSWTQYNDSSLHWFSDNLTGAGRYRCYAIMDIANRTSTTYLTKNGINLETRSFTFQPQDINSTDSIEALTFGALDTTSNTGNSNACCSPAVGWTLHSFMYFTTPHSNDIQTRLLNGTYSNIFIEQIINESQIFNTIINPPFYDLSNNLITSYEGAVRSQNPVVDASLDLTQPIKITNISFRDTTEIYADISGQAAGSYTGAFKSEDILNFKFKNTDLSNLDVIDFSGSFDTGGYIVALRRNFYRGTTNEPNAKEPYYTLNSQYIYVSPNQESTQNYSLPIFDSSNLLFENNSFTNNTFDLTTPIYGAYNADGSNIDISFNFYINFDNDNFNPKWQPNGLYTVNGNKASVELTKLYFDYLGLGDGYFIMDVSYNWTAPQQMDLPIGKIGGVFPVVKSAEFNTDLSGYPFTYPANNNLNTIVKPNMGVTNTIIKELPNDNSFTQLNEIKELQAEFIGTETTRMLGIKWREPNVNNLDTTYTGYPYAVRLYKKSAVGNIENDQWYPRDNDGSAGIDPYKWKPDYFSSSPDLSNLVYDGVEISANFFPQNTNDNYVFFFADASGKVFYNEYPSNTDVIKPFTEPGGYIIVVQRHYRDLSDNRAFTAYGQYVSFIPVSETNPWPIKDTAYPVIESNPNPYSSYEPIVDGGAQNLKFYWTLQIPNINYNDIIPNEDTSAVNVETIQQEFRNRGKEAYITSYVTYDFGISTRPFIERYPLFRINGNPNYTTPSQRYETNLCSTTVPLTAPEWPRFRTECVDATPEEREALQMRRKAETLFHVSNRNDMQNNKRNWFSFVAKGNNQKRETYATQTDKFTNPNTKNYPVLSGARMTLPTDCPRRPITSPSTSSDVPGPAVPLTYDPSVPLVNYKVFRTYTNSETEYAEKNKN